MCFGFFFVLTAEQAVDYFIIGHTHDIHAPQTSLESSHKVFRFVGMKPSITKRENVLMLWRIANLISLFI